MPYISSAQPPARGPHSTRDGLLSGPQRPRENVKSITWIYMYSKLFNLGYYLSYLLAFWTSLSDTSWRDCELHRYTTFRNRHGGVDRRSVWGKFFVMNGNSYHFAPSCLARGSKKLCTTAVGNNVCKLCCEKIDGFGMYGRSKFGLRHWNAVLPHTLWCKSNIYSKRFQRSNNIPYTMVLPSMKTAAPWQSVALTLAHH